MALEGQSAGAPSVEVGSGSAAEARLATSEKRTAQRPTMLWHGRASMVASCGWAGCPPAKRYATSHKQTSRPSTGRVLRCQMPSETKPGRQQRRLHPPH